MGNNIKFNRETWDLTFGLNAFRQQLGGLNFNKKNYHYVIFINTFESNAHAYTHAHTYTHSYTYMHTLTHAYTHTHSYTHMHTLTHAYTHTHTHTHALTNCSLDFSSQTNE